MKLAHNLIAYINRAFRIHYENRVSLPFGMARFLSNIAFIQLADQEYLDMMPLSGTANMWITTTGMRPLLNYSVFIAKKGQCLGEWKPVNVIIEEKGLQVKDQTDKQDGWKRVGMNLEDPRVAPLRDLFLANAFHTPFVASHKRKIENKQHVEG